MRNKVLRKKTQRIRRWALSKTEDQPFIKSKEAALLRLTDDCPASRDSPGVSSAPV